MNDPDFARDVTVANAEATLKYTKRLLKPLKATEKRKRQLSMAPRQAGELVRFINVYDASLRKYIKKAKEKEKVIYMQYLLTMQMDMEEALQFVEQSFIRPRLRSSKQQTLEAADWFCFQGFDHLIKEDGRFEIDRSKGPIGPLVAIDSRRSPAVWKPGEALPFPSLFQKSTKLIERTDDPANNQRALANFPLICLPSVVVYSPELYVLLSHEVGHAADSVLELKEAVLEDLAGDEDLEYWEAWMREIIADAAGLALSGEAYALSLASYIRWMKVKDEPVTSNPYPGVTLRMQMLLDAITKFGRGDSVIARKLHEEFGEKKVADYVARLRKRFGEIVMEPLYKRFIPKPKQWCEEQAAIEKLGSDFAGSEDQKWLKGNDFRLMPSAVAMAKLKKDSIETAVLFKKLHASVDDADKPEWVTDPVIWEFAEDVLPTLRPTFLGPDGKTKVPPLELLKSHQRIAFVGATNGQLANFLKIGYEERAEGQKPWPQLELFFADDAVLKKVERVPGEDLVAERETAKGELLELLQSEKIAENWAMYQFDDNLVFASYWDWNEPDGRIHVSAQLLGTDLRQCPSFDHIWYDETPSLAYEKYRTHLKSLRESSERFEASESWQLAY